MVDNTTPGGTLVPVGGPITVTGNAWVGDCNDRKIKCVDLRAAIGWLQGPNDAGFAGTLPQYTIPMLPAPICYDDVDEKLKRAWWNKLQGFHVHLTRFWHKINLPPPIWVLEEAPFNSAAGLPLGVMRRHVPRPAPPLPQRQVHAAARRLRHGRRPLLRHAAGVVRQQADDQQPARALRRARGLCRRAPT